MSPSTNPRPYIEIWRITEGPQTGKYRVRAFRPDGYQAMRSVGVYRYLWVARWLGKVDAQDVLTGLTTLRHPSRGQFIERIDL
jgi:hypothetical protein